MSIVGNWVLDSTAKASMGTDVSFASGCPSGIRATMGSFRSKIQLWSPSRSLIRQKSAPVKGKHLQELYPLYRGCGTHYSAGDPVMDICKPVSVKCSSSGYRDWLGIVEFVLERVLFKKKL